jgi:type IV pilus assembly protein PilB
VRRIETGGTLSAESGSMSESESSRTLAASLGMHFVDLDAITLDPLAIKLVPEKVARRHTIIPILEDNRTITYASAVAPHHEVERDLAFASGRRPSAVIACRSQIAAALGRAYSQSSDVNDLIERIKHAGAVDPAGVTVPMSPVDSPVVDLCNRILAAAINAGASDLHLEPGAAGAAVRHRVCGILEPLLMLPPAAVRGVTNRFKILARADIATRHKPQDGAFRVTIDGRTIDVRLSSLPTTHGEKLVMRVIDSASAFQTFETLGYDAAACTRLRRALSKPDGLVLVTGPTGSGKTTALYAALQFLKTGRVNIVTVEDPVERLLEGVTQIPVNPRSGSSFPSVLRSVMRQDPNIIMVGEIRDSEVADIVGQAAYTGHLVLSTLHTTDAASAITRLRNLGLHPYKIAESLNAVVAQRLIRTLCPHCRTAVDEVTARRAGARHHVRALPAAAGQGCARCKYTGYLGRVAVPEILTPNETLQCAIRDGAGAAEIRKAMREAGCISMREAALELATQGITSLDEVERVFSTEDDISRPQPLRDKVRILVTDDDRMIRMLVRMLLEREGYEVLEADNGETGLETARRERPDLMLVDLMMPSMDGFQTIERIRRDVALATMPVIVLTSETGATVEKRVLGLGADDYLVKPFDADVLVSRVRAMFRRLAQSAA